MRTWLRLFGSTSVLFLLTVACSDSDSPAGGSTTTPAATSTARELAVSAASSGTAKKVQRGAPMPAALRMAMMRTQQAAPGHDFVAGGGGALTSHVGAAKAVAAVHATGAGVHLSSDGTSPAGAYELDVQTTSVGREGGSGATGSASHVLSQHAEGQELVLARDGEVEERYLAGPLGLEQSYVVGAAPAGTGRLSIDVAFDGLSPELQAGAVDRVLLADRAGKVRAGYRDVIAVDRAGRELPSRMEVHGSTVTLSIDDAGAAYPVSIDPVVWTLQQELTPSSDGAAGDTFGTSVAIDGTTAVVGSPDHATGKGAAYIWSQSGSSWTMVTELTAGDGVAGDNFGQSVAISGSTVVVGAPYHAGGGKAEAGAAYVFTGSGSSWTQAPDLVANGGAVADHFGTSVSISGTNILVGAPGHAANGFSEAGAVYPFTGSGSSWTQGTAITASDGAVADLFGFSVSVSGSIAIVGAYQHTVGSGASALVSAGAAYVYTSNGSAWTQKSELTASDAAISDFFGYSVSVSGTTAIVGAYQHNVGTGASEKLSAGSAYIFTQGSGNWAQAAELQEGTPAAGDNFGIAVSLDAGTAVVGAWGANGNAGEVYGFTLIGGTWTPGTPITAGDSTANGSFGVSVASSGDLLIAGALTAGTSAPGAAYVYSGAFNGTTDCYIDGTEYPSGATDPNDACQVCTPTTSTTGWSPITCTAEDQCHTAGTCSAGVCSNPPKANGTACSTGTCQDGVCTSGAVDAGSGVDAGIDSGSPPGIDAGIDSGTRVDAGVDSGSSGMEDSGSGVDSGIDAGIDSGSDEDAATGADGGCVPTTCGAAQAACGSVPDNCGGTLQCGSCDPGYDCEQNVCEPGTDGGTGQDAATPVDAGRPLSFPDSGTRDAGTARDAGGDAQSNGGGGVAGENSGCSCRTVQAENQSRSGLFGFGVLALLGGLRLRRRRPVEQAGASDASDANAR